MDRQLAAQVADRFDLGPDARLEVEAARGEQGQVRRLVTARGESAPSVPQVLNHIIAPLYHHAVFALPIDDDFATDLAADVMATVR